MTDYTPNFSDPRVRRRCETALAFVSQYVQNTAVPVAQSQIIKHFGNPSLALGGWLKQQLLICVDPHWNMLTGKCKRYRRCVEGYAALENILGTEAVSLTATQQQELASGEFEYVEKSDRLYNPLQMLPRRRRDRVMYEQGYRYDYDIRCAAATLLTQQAQQSDPSLSLPHCEYYLNNRDLVREELSIALNIPTDKIKTILTALFQGAQLGLNPHTRIYQLLNANTSKIQQVKSNQFITSLRSEIRTIWRTIARDMNSKRLSGRDKAGVYRALEKRVMAVIRRELRRTHNPHLLIHDGWVCKEISDIKLIREQVRNQTGFVIDIDWTILSQV